MLKFLLKKLIKTLYMDPNDINHPNYNHIPIIGSSVCPQDGSGSTTIAHNINNLQNLNCADLESISANNFAEDLVKSEENAGVGASPPTNLTYTFADNLDFSQKENYSINIYWTDPSASIQGIQIYRTDFPSLIFFKAAPSIPTTTNNWLDTSGSTLNPIVNLLEWSKYYYYNLRTVYQFAGTSNIYSDWVQLYVFQINDELRRINDKCAIETLKSLESRLTQNFNELPKAYQYSKIVRGGARKVICQTWRPQGWNDGSFPKEDYPITLQTEEAAKNAAAATGDVVADDQNSIISETAAISKYTGNLIFGTAALNFKEGVQTTSLQVYPCGQLRRTGSKLPIN